MGKSWVNQLAFYGHGFNRKLLESLPEGNPLPIRGMNKTPSLKTSPPAERPDRRNCLQHSIRPREYPWRKKKVVFVRFFRNSSWFTRGKLGGLNATISDGVCIPLDSHVKNCLHLDEKSEA